MRSLIFGLIVLLFHSSGVSAAPAARDASCKSLLEYIYKELTLQNMDKSVKRLNYKMVLGLAQVMENVDKRGINLRKNPEILSLMESMADIDKSLAPWLENNNQHSKYRFWNFLPFNSRDYNKVSYQRIIKRWKDLQSQRPSLFRGLEERFLLDDWDLKTSRLMENYAELKIADETLKSRLDDLANKYAKDLKELEGGLQTPKLSLRHTKKLVDRLHQSFNKEAGKIVASALEDHESACSQESFNAYLSQENMACPVTTPEKAAALFSEKLKDISEVVGTQLINSAAPPKAPAVSGPTVSELEIIDYDYKNINYQGNFCERSPKMVDTAVIHHSGTDNKDSPQDINDTQVVMHENDRNSSGDPDPWYMIAYNYVINSPYGNESGETKVYRGRPDKMKGAHAGAYINLDQLEPEARKELLKGPIRCGHNSDQDPEHSLDSVSASATAITKSEIGRGYVSANITSVGVLVTGNYAPDILNGRPNPSGYPRNGAIRYPTAQTLKTTASLICKLRSGAYPNLKKITDHNWIKLKKSVADGQTAYGTCCPGTVYKRMNQLLQLVKAKCPQYEFKLDISPKEKVCGFLR